MKKSIFAVLLLIVTFQLSSCLKNSGNCSFDACATVAPTVEIQTVQNYILSNSLVATQHCSGLFYRIENPGTGAVPGACANIGVTYKAYFTSGTLLEQETTPIGLSLGQTVRAWRIGMPLIKAGGRIVLYVPPSLAYGAQDVRDQNGNIVIPANSYMIFEVDLVSVQ